MQGDKNSNGRMGRNHAHIIRDKRVEEVSFARFDIVKLIQMGMATTHDVQW